MAAAFMLLIAQTAASVPLIAAHVLLSTLTAQMAAWWPRPTAWTQPCSCGTAGRGSRGPLLRDIQPVGDLIRYQPLWQPNDDLR
jgi:hypothetical protein